MAIGKATMAAAWLDIGCVRKTVSAKKTVSSQSGCAVPISETSCHATYFAAPVCSIAARIRFLGRDAARDENEQRAEHHRQRQREHAHRDQCEDADENRNDKWRS